MSLFLTVGAMAQSYTFEVIDIKSNADAMLYSNAPCKVADWGDQFVGWHVLFDDNTGTFFHSDYSGDPSVDGLDHYLRVDMGENNSISQFTFTFKTRNTNCTVNSPTTIVVEGSNAADGSYTEIATLTGLPTTNSTLYTSPVLGSEGVSYRYIRYRVTATQSGQTKGGKVFFFIAEFGMSKATPKPVYETEEVGNPTEDGVYRVYWKQNNRGYLAYHNSYPTKGVLADVTLGNYGSSHFNSATDPVQLEWYLITSEKGNKYLFSAYNGKFLSYSEESADDAKAAYFDAARPLPITIADNTSHQGYYIIKATVDGRECLLSSGCGTPSRTGYPIRWNSNVSGDMGDGGSPLIFVKVKNFPMDETVLAHAQAAIADYENPVEANVNFELTTSSSLTAVENPAYYTSTVLNDNALSGGIKYIEGEITVGGARTATVTFTYIDGGHKLNIRGVEVIDAKGNIVAGDYGVKTAGGDKVGQVYTVKVAEAGTYKVRCYATEGDGDSFSSSHGSIVVSFAKLDVIGLTKEVTFAAEYSTLYLGYKVAIPAGVEAYVLSSVNGSWAILTQVEDVIPANTAVILKKTGTTNEYHFYYTSDDADEIELNFLEGSIADRYIQGDAYVLGIPEGETEACLCPALLNKVDNTSFKNNANKAYLKVAPGISNVSFYGFRFDDEEDGEEENTTAIENVETATVNVIYDLSGRRVSEITEKGIYIVNGKKVLVK